MAIHVFYRSMLLATLSLGMVTGCELLTGGGEGEPAEIPAAQGARVPKQAELVAQGRGELSHKARADGQIWLHDATAEKTLYSVPVRRGQRFTIAPSEDRASLDGKDVFEGDMQPRSEHKIYYLPK